MRRKALAALSACLVASCVSIPGLVTSGADGGSGGGDGGADVALDRTVDDGAAEAPDGFVVADAADAADVMDVSEGGTHAPGDAAVPCPGPYASAVEALSGLVAYWRLGETAGPTAHDVLGAHDGTYGASVVLGQPGLLVGDPDRAAGFGGDAGSSVDVPSDPAFDLQTFTLGAIIRPSAIVLADMGQQIVARPDAYWLQLDAPTNSADQPSIEVGIITPQLADYPSQFRRSTLGVGLTAHVVGTYDGSTVTAYVDGAYAGALPVQATVGSPANAVHIGSWDGVSHFQSGIVDEVFVVGRALTAAEVAGLYEAAQGCVYDGGD